MNDTVDDLFRLFPDLPRTGQTFATYVRKWQEERVAKNRQRARLTTERQRAKVEANRTITDGRRDAASRHRRKG